MKKKSPTKKRNSTVRKPKKTYKLTGKRNKIKMADDI